MLRISNLKLIHLFINKFNTQNLIKTASCKNIHKKINNKMTPTKRSRTQSITPPKNSSSPSSTDSHHPEEPKCSIKKKICLSRLSLTPPGAAAASSKTKIQSKITDFQLKITNLNDNDDQITVKKDVTEDIEIEEPLEKYKNLINKLDLTNWQRCRIIDIQNKNEPVQKCTSELKIIVQNDKTKAIGICLLQNPWSLIKLKKNDIVSIIGNWYNDLGCYVVNQDYGYCVVKPDFLISGTAVVGSLFCKRKSVLQDKFHGLDSCSREMVIGSIIHELFQIILKKQLDSLKSMQKTAEELLHTKDMIFMLNSCNLSFKEATEEIDKFLPQIVTFIEQYIQGDSPSSGNITANSFQGQIETIQDIEENVWIPQFGLKGKIDVTVKIHHKNRCNEKRIIPLELKTGRASFSMEHKGQLILYQMMLNELGAKVNSGLLLYLRDGIMQEIIAKRNEKRDLIILRNDLAYYLTQNINLLNNGNDLPPQFSHLELPEPINHHSACSKCPSNIICSTFLLNNPNSQLSNNHKFYELSKECTAHLQPKDFQYFQFWYGIITLELNELNPKTSAAASSIASLWLDSLDERTIRGKTIGNLIIDGLVEFQDNKFIHTFITKQSDVDFTLTTINVGDYVNVSTMKRIAIAAGHIIKLHKTAILISLERNLFENYPTEQFIIDKSDSLSNMIFNYTNLGILLNNTKIINNLREIIINEIPAKFTKHIDGIHKTELNLLLKELNADQKNALIKALTCDNYMLIKGLPGTGKTQTLIHIIRVLNILNKSILITSHTHSAIDNILIRLKKFNIKFLRLGNINRIHNDLHENCEINLLKNIHDPTELTNLYHKYNIIAVTCYGCTHHIFNIKSEFDICIVDEATQIYQPTILRPLFYAKKFILVGDPNQLPPVIRSIKSKQLNGDESLFNRLDNAETTSTLNLQYRMNKSITKLANDFTYKQELKCANSEVSAACLKLPNELNLKNNKENKWILQALAKHIDQSVILINTPNTLNENQQFDQENFNINHINYEEFMLEHTADDIRMNERKYQYINYCEISIILILLKCLKNCGVLMDNVGIIAPYRSQVELIQKLLLTNSSKIEEKLQYNFENLEINTVDQYQGRDKDIIIYSCTKSGNSSLNETSNPHEILSDQRRLTVAVTRAKHKLIMIGDENYLMKYKPFENLFMKIPKRCKIQLENNTFDFQWKNILKNLQEIL